MVRSKSTWKTLFLSQLIQKRLRNFLACLVPVSKFNHGVKLLHKCSSSARRAYENNRHNIMERGVTLMAQLLS